MARPKELETIIEIAGKLDESLKKSINDAVNKLGNIQEATGKASDAMRAMNMVANKQAEALKQAKNKYASYVLENKEATEEAQQLAEEIKQLNKDLSGNKKAIDAAKQAADKLTDEYDFAAEALKLLGKETKSSSDGFTIMKGAAADLVSNGIQKIIGGARDAISSLMGLAESTREYREDMGKLETAWQSAGKSTELATEAYKQLYAVLGEEDRSVEAVNHLAKFVDTEKDLAKWSNIMTGVWGTFGDSLPIEGLTEAA